MHHAPGCNLTSLVVLQGVLLDQFGVLHDGNTAYNGAIDAVKWMADQEMAVVILSNSSKSTHLLFAGNQSSSFVHGLARDSKH